MHAPYPWQLPVWQQMCAEREAGRLPHAILLHGRDKSGKAAFAHAFVQSGLCMNPGPAGACGACSACSQVLAGSHPDLVVTEHAEDKRDILIDQVRDFCDRVRLTSTRGSQRYGLMLEADRLNEAAANSLLKTLEEPPSGVILLLTASNLSLLPATVRSRCSQRAIALPLREPAAAWLAAERPEAMDLLEAAGGNPLAAIRLLEESGGTRLQKWARGLQALRDGQTDPCALAAEIDPETFPEFLTWWQSWLLSQARRDPREGWFAVWDELLSTKRSARQSINRLLALEGLFILFTQAIGPANATRGQS